MGFIKDALSQLGRLQESLGLELKTWIDPLSIQGEAKIAKACIAMRNNDGGRIIIGFNNQTGLPDTVPSGFDVDKFFHIDNIQKIIGKYASEPFEVEVDLEEIDGTKYPSIIIKPGVRTLNLPRIESVAVKPPE